MPNNLIPMVPLSALSNIDGQHQGMPQHCWIPQVSSSSNHGQNIVHAPPHAPICSMGPPLNGGQLYHCLSDVNGGGGVNTVGGILTAQQQPSHPTGSSGVMLNIMQYPTGAKSSIVSSSAADTNHPQGPLPPTPIEPEPSIMQGQPPTIMELPSRPASAGAAAISAASYLGLETGYQNHVGQRQQHLPLFHQQMEPVLSHQEIPISSSISCLPPGGSSGGGVRELTSSRRGSQLRKQQSISCAYEYCDDKIGPIRHQPPHLQSIPDIHG